VVEAGTTLENDQETLVKVGLRDTLKKILKENIGWLVLMSVIILGIYFNSLGGNFVSDDYASITQNPYIGDFLYNAGKGNSMNFGTYFIYKLFGYGSPVPYHLAAVLGFIIFCWIAYIFLEIVFKNDWLTRLTMLLFVFHPIHVEAVTWISGRIYVIIATYVMLSVIGLIFYFRDKKIRYLLLFLGAFILAFLTDKPRVFAVFLIAGVYVLTVGFKNIKVNWGKMIAGALGLGIIFMIIAWPYITNRINVVNSGYNLSESIFYNPFFQYPTGISKYLQLLWFPIDLTLYHTMYIFPGWLNWAIILTYLTAIIYFYFKNKTYFFALAFILAAVLPSIAPVKVSWLVAERYMFLGSLGFCLFMALLIMDVGRFYKLILPVLVGIIIGCFGIRTVWRNVDWQTNHNLWVNTCQVSPNSHNAWNNIGDDYDKLKQYDNAIKGFTQSTLIKTNYADAYHNRANIFFKIGRLDLARDSYSTALYYSPNLYQTYLSLTQIDLMENKPDLAIQHASKALEIDPTNPQAAYVMAVVDAQTGKVGEAETILNNIIKQIPNYQPAIQALQQLKMGIGGTK